MLKATTQRILEAYSLVDTEVRYVQGMHAVAASLVYNNFLGFIETMRLRTGP